MVNTFQQHYTGHCMGLPVFDAHKLQEDGSTCAQGQDTGQPTKQKTVCYYVLCSLLK
jgi:hypothetical protein